MRPPSGYQHSKLLLFRCAAGSRVVISGNNLTDQWERDRDAFWAQDFPAGNGAPTCSGDFGIILGAFLERVAGCRSLEDRGFVAGLDVLRGVAFDGAAIRVLDAAGAAAGTVAGGLPGTVTLDLATALFSMYYNYCTAV